MDTAIILVLYNAGPLDVSWAVNSDKVVAILESYFPAQVILSFKHSNSTSIVYSHGMHGY